MTDTATATHTPTPTAPPAATWSLTPPATPLPTHTPTPTRTSTPRPGSAFLRITALNYSAQDEVVTLHNDEGRSVTMTGWKLISVVGTQTYTFPVGYVLAGGADVRVHSGPAAGASNPPDDLRWPTGYIWNNDGDKAEVRDPAGGLLDSWCYKAGCP